MGLCASCIRPCLPQNTTQLNPGGSRNNDDKEDGVEFKSLLQEAEDEIFESDPYTDDVSIGDENESILTRAQNKWTPSTQTLQSDSEYSDDDGPMSATPKGSARDGADGAFAADSRLSASMHSSNGPGGAPPDLSWLSDDDEDLGLDNISDYEPDAVDFGADDDPMVDPQTQGLGAGGALMDSQLMQPPSFDREGTLPSGNAINTSQGSSIQNTVATGSSQQDPPDDWTDDWDQDDDDGWGADELGDDDFGMEDPLAESVSVPARKDMEIDC